MIPLQLFQPVAGPLLAILCGIGLGIIGGIAGGSSKLAVFWGFAFYVYLTVETQQDFVWGLFLVVIMLATLAAAAYGMRFFFGSAHGGT